MNNVAIIGNLVADPELRQTTNGKDVCNIRVAVNRGQDKGADFFNATCWEGTAKAVAEHLSKGSKVGISGRLQSREYEKDGVKRQAVEIVATRVDFLGAPNGSTPREEVPPPDDQDIPF